MDPVKATCRCCWRIWSASGQCRDTYQPAIEQLLVCLLPEGVAIMQAISLTDKDTKWEGG